MKIPYDADLFDDEHELDNEMENFEKFKHKKPQQKMTYRQDNKKRNKPKRGGKDKDVWTRD